MRASLLTAGSRVDGHQRRPHGQGQRVREPSGAAGRPGRSPASTTPGRSSPRAARGRGARGVPALPAPPPRGRPRRADVTRAVGDDRAAERQRQSRGFPPRTRDSRTATPRTTCRSRSGSRSGSRTSPLTVLCRDTRRRTCRVRRERASACSTCSRKASVPSRRAARAEATRPALLSAFGSGQYDVIHYAGHAFFDPQSPEQSGILCHGARAADRSRPRRPGQAAVAGLLQRVRVGTGASGPAARRERRASRNVTKQLSASVGLAEAFMRGGVATSSERTGRWATTPPRRSRRSSTRR